MDHSKPDSSTATLQSYLDHLGIDPKRVTMIGVYSPTATDGIVKLQVVDWQAKAVRLLTD